MKKNNKGFTLIELLAIIVILAIIAVITVPIILNIIENSRKGAASDSAYGFKDAVNKYYVQQLSENNKLKLNDTYTVTNGTLSDGNFGDEDTTSLPITASGTIPSSGKLHYTNNVLDDGCLVISDYKITFKSDGSVNEIAKGNCDDYVIAGSIVSLPIGTDVDYVTSLNNITLDDWKVFYTEGNYTYLIYGDYLPNAAININGLSGISKNNTYGIYSDSKNRKQLLDVMTTKSNWDSLLSGSINGHAVNQTRSENVWAMGTPDIELWKNSWNKTHPEEKIYTTSTTSEMNDGYFGYYIGKTPNPNTYSVTSMTNSDVLYFVFQSNPASDGSWGFWLASAMADHDYNMPAVAFYGSIQDVTCNNTPIALRPVIKLPTSVVN